MVYKTLFLGNSIYKFHRGHKGAVLLTRSEFNESTPAGSEPPVVEKVEFESETSLDNFMKRIIPMKQSGEGCSLVMLEELKEVIFSMRQHGYNPHFILTAIEDILKGKKSNETPPK